MVTKVFYRFPCAFMVTVSLGLLGSVCALTVGSDGGYKNLVVSLSSLDTVDGKRILNNLQAILNKASEFLQTLSESRLHFSEVIFLIPESWNSTDWWYQDQRPVEESETARDDEAQVKVVEVGQLHADKPYVLQHAGCGQQGKFIHFPAQILKSPTPDLDELARHFVHAWSRYRYGLFPEHGFPDDPLYPDYYTPIGTKNRTYFLHNSCSYPTIGTTGKTSNGRPCDPKTSLETGLPEDNGCSLEPELDSDTKVESSFMAFPSLELKVNHYCNDKSHDSEKPTKHNVLCNGESAASVFKKNPDFKNARSTGTTKNVPITVRYVMGARESTHLSIIYGLGSEHNRESRKNLLRLLARHVMEQIPENVTLHILRYPEREQGDSLNIQTTVLSTQEVRDKLARTISGESEIYQNSKLEDALNFWLTDTKLHPSGRSSVVLISDGRLSSQAATKFEREFALSRIRVDLIVYPVVKDTDTSQAEKMVRASGGRVWAVEELYPKDSPNGILTQLKIDQALKDSLRGHAWSEELDTRIVRKVFYPEQIIPKEEVRVPFSIQADIVDSLTVTIYEQSIADTSPATDKDSVKISMQGKLSQLDFDTEPLEPPRYFRTIENNYHRKLSSGEITFRFKESSGPRRPVVVDISAKLSSTKNEIKLDAWLGTNTEAKAGNPVIIYTYVEMDGQPVRGVDVTAVISKPDGKFSPVKLSLLDNGLGDPDITKDDGVYSRYFANFVPEAGHYSVLITADDNKGAAEVIRGTFSNKGHGAVCCGSAFPIGSKSKASTFKKELELGSFYRTRQSYNRDTFMPSRICDLKARNFDENERTFDLVWTAPGNDYDNGIAAKYVIKYFNKYASAHKLFESEGEALLEAVDYPEGPFSPAPYGTEQKLKITLRTTGQAQYLYFAMRAEDSTNNKGDTSNIVTVYRHIHQQEVGTASAINLSTGLAIGVTALSLVAMSIISIVVCRMKRTRRQSIKSNGNRNRNARPNSLQLPVGHDEIRQRSTEPDEIQLVPRQNPTERDKIRPVPRRNPTERDEIRSVLRRNSSQTCPVTHL